MRRIFHCFQNVPEWCERSRRYSATRENEVITAKYKSTVTTHKSPNQRDGLVNTIES